MGFFILVVLEVSVIYELFQKAKIQHWRYFWIDVACLCFLSAILGFVVVDAFNYHMRRRREKAQKG